MTHRDTTCLLCGHTSNDVSVALIEWKRPIGRDRFTSAPRCKDRTACRGRAEASGEWELAETPASTRELIEGRR